MKKGPIPHRGLWRVLHAAFPKNPMPKNQPVSRAPWVNMPGSRTGVLCVQRGPLVQVALQLEQTDVLNNALLAHIQQGGPRHAPYAKQERLSLPLEHPRVLHALLANMRRGSGIMCVRRVQRGKSQLPLEPPQKPPAHLVPLDLLVQQGYPYALCAGLAPSRHWLAQGVAAPVRLVPMQLGAAWLCAWHVVQANSLPLPEGLALMSVRTALLGSSRRPL